MSTHLEKPWLAEGKISLKEFTAEQKEERRKWLAKRWASNNPSRMKKSKQKYEAKLKRERDEVKEVILALRRRIHQPPSAIDKLARAEIEKLPEFVSLKESIKRLEDRTSKSAPREPISLPPDSS